MIVLRIVWGKFRCQPGPSQVSPSVPGPCGPVWAKPVCGDVPGEVWQRRGPTGLGSSSSWEVCDLSPGEHTCGRLASAQHLNLLLSAPHTSFPTHEATFPPKETTPRVPCPALRSFAEPRRVTLFMTNDGSDFPCPGGHRLGPAPQGPLCLPFRCQGQKGLSSSSFSCGCTASAAGDLRATFSVPHQQEYEAEQSLLGAVSPGPVLPWPPLFP